jgi:hypothetical protein
VPPCPAQDILEGILVPFSGGDFVRSLLLRSVHIVSEFSVLVAPCSECSFVFFSSPLCFSCHVGVFSVHFPAPSHTHSYFTSAQTVQVPDVASEPLPFNGGGTPPLRAAFPSIHPTTQPRSPQSLFTPAGS